MPFDGTEFYQGRYLEARPYLKYVSLLSRIKIDDSVGYIVEINAINARNGDDRKVLVTEDLLIEKEGLVKICLIKDIDKKTMLIGVMDVLAKGHSLKHVNKSDIVWKLVP